MITPLFELVTQVRQPVIELMLHVTFWAALGILLYFVSRRLVQSSRELLLYFCLGILGLSLLILFPIKLWSPPASWQTHALTEQLSWQVSNQTETAEEGAHNSTNATPVPATSASSIELGDCLTIAFIIVGLLVAFALARLLLGLISLECWRRSSEPINDPMLIEQFATLCRQMGITKSISLRVTNQLGSPATIGWWRPTILLPSSWTVWSSSERQAVLAHELAHVRNSDYPLWLAVQLAAALHTYHPFVRLLVKRLQGELELSADHLAAPYAGGTTNYMRTLCQLALRHGSRGAGQLSLALFPVQIPLSWRMMMLRSPTKTRRMPGIWSPLCLLGLLATLAVAISGFRGATVADEKKFDDQIVFAPSGSEKPADHPNSRLVSMELMILDMKKSELKKLDWIQQDGVYPATQLPESIEGIKKRLTGIAFQERIPACTISAWSEVPTGICITNKEKEGKALLVTPCLSADGQTLELKSRIETLRKNPTAENGMEQTKVYEHSSKMKLHESACFVMPYDAVDKLSDTVRLTFVSITSAKPLDGTVPKDEGKPNYEIEIKLAAIRTDQFQTFWKDVTGNLSAPSPSLAHHHYLKLEEVHKVLEIVQGDVRNSVLIAPRLITISGRPARIVTSAKSNDSISIGCLVKETTENTVELTLSQEIIAPGKNTKEDRTVMSQGFTVALADDKYFCFYNEYPEASKSQKDTTLVSLVKVKRIKLPPSDK